MEDKKTNKTAKPQDAKVRSKTVADSVVSKKAAQSSDKIVEAKHKATGSQDKKNQSFITIKQIGSPIRRDPRQKLYLKSLGLGKINRQRTIVDNPSTRGLLVKLTHMLVVLEQ